VEQGGAKKLVKYPESLPMKALQIIEIKGTDFIL
jgi:hypothetical protein